MNQRKVNYTEKEILEIFKEQHRLCSHLDAEANPDAEISAEMTISEWRLANDLLAWWQLASFLNKKFRIEIPEQEWFAILEPADERKLNLVCKLIAKYAKKDNYESKVLFGTPCLKAGVFLKIKNNLRDKGVDVSDLRPSSSISEYIKLYFSEIIEEITLTGTKPIDKIESRKRKKGFWNAINIFDPDRFEISTGEVKTFGNLVEKIIEEKTKSKSL